MADQPLKNEPPFKRQKLNEEGTDDSEQQGCSNINIPKDNEAGNTEQVHEAQTDNSDNCSEISNLSGLSEEAWKPTSGAMTWIHKQIMNGVNPRPILNGLIPDDTLIPNDIDDFTLWKIVINIMSEPPPRKKLSHINTLQDVIQLLQNCTNIMVLTGAGVSVSCGIPDFRSRDGIYARLAVDFPDLPDPQAMFDINYFSNDPRPFFKFAKEIYPGQFEPSRSHKFINTIEKHGKLLRNYTQNIDTLEQVAGITKVIQCHGSFATATCMSCKHKVSAEIVREDIFNQVIPKCSVCPPDSPTSIMKPDIVFFGESLSDEFHKQMTEDKDKCDLLIVIGSSLKVRPVALIPNSLPEDVPQILINREPLKHLNFDVELLGDCDAIVEELCKHLNWDNKSRSPLLHEISKCELKTPTSSDLDDSGSDNDVKGQGSLENKSEEGKSDDRNCDQKTAKEVSNLQHVKVCDEIDENNSVKNDKKPHIPVSVVLDNSESCTVINKSDSSPVITSQKTDETDGLTINGNTSLETSSKIIESETQDRSVADESRSKTTSENSKLDSKDSSLSGKSKNNSALAVDSNKNGLLLSDDPKDEEDDDDEDFEITNMWKSGHHGSLAKRLEGKQYLFLPPSRYVFSGAEVYSDMEDDSDSDISSMSSSSDDESQNSINDDEKNDSNTLPSVNDVKEDSELHLVNGEERKDSNTLPCTNGEKKNCELQLVNGDERNDSKILPSVNGEKEDSKSHLVNGEGSINNETKDINNPVNSVFRDQTNLSCKTDLNTSNGMLKYDSQHKTKPLQKLCNGMHQSYDELEEPERQVQSADKHSDS
ncbi:NAD-dependent protein deacetylase sirtuin-1-like [Mytilus edulis]|uniref:NAD-dependent protein deacetylase sirtuin-1-like n=1 Tax=Mytilus edulis TaxID=6550 RepID=UPI0039EFF34E